MGSSCVSTSCPPAEMGTSFQPTQRPSPAPRYCVGTYDCLHGNKKPSIPWDCQLIPRPFIASCLLPSLGLALLSLPIHLVVPCCPVLGGAGSWE